MKTGLKHIAAAACLLLTGCGAERAAEEPPAAAVEPAGRAEQELPSGVAAVIGPYTITVDQLQQRLNSEAAYARSKYGTEPVKSAGRMLRTMVAEKAMILDALRKNLLDREPSRTTMARFKDKVLANILLRTKLADKINVNKEEIEQKLKADPKLDRARAEQMLQRQKANELFNEYYKKIYEKNEVEKSPDNLAAVAEIHQDLLANPVQKGPITFIRGDQVRQQLTAKQKEMVLATYTGGVITIKDWFDFLCEMSPPSRPKDLNTAAGADRLLEGALRIPLLAAEARILGLHESEEYLNQVRQREEATLQALARREALKDMGEPSGDEIEAYFNAHREQFEKDGKPQEYSSDLDNRIKAMIWREERDHLLDEYEADLLAKYPYRINENAIVGVRPVLPKDEETESMQRPK